MEEEKDWSSHMVEASGIGTVYTMAIKTQDLFTNKAHASPEDKDAVQCSDFHKLISFISGKYVEGQQQLHICSYRINAIKG